MSKIKEVLRHLFPKGTRIRGGKDISHCTDWPPDLFAATATLIRASECYSSQKFTAPNLRARTNKWFFSEKYVEDVQRLGEKWSENGFPPMSVERHWEALLTHGDVELTDSSRLEWAEHAMTLLGIADEACAGIGFVYGRKSKVPDFYLVNYYLYRKDGLNPLLPHLPWSLCVKVSCHQVCVQPKTRTPQVGCTLRSLSRNLSLLPPIGEVKTYWNLAISSEDAPAVEEEPLNLLLVPYPYRIRGTCFAQGKAHGSTFGLFSVNQKWLRKSDGTEVKQEDMRAFITDLIDKACEEVSQIHGVVLPECALDEKLARELAIGLAEKTDLELFICGSLGSPSENSAVVGNQVESFIFLDHAIYESWVQRKHHRWRLDCDQIRRYHLGHVLRPDTFWWEGINIDQRECHFYVFRHGASLATLVCEDLARIDPVQTVLRSVGPNLVIVLLMDGPQWERRWPGRYATSLADDPGSAVLTLTSLGMIRRSIMPGESEPLEIALWKDSSGIARELKLPKGAHALAVTLSSSWENNRTLDNRQDDRGTLRLNLTGVHPITLKRMPDWIDY